MLSVGQQLREQRLRLGLKLEEISAKTCISVKTLQAIETDDLAKLSAPFLYKSFARQLAEQVKLDYQEIGPAVESAALSMPQPLMPGEAESGKTQVAPLPLKGRKKTFRWLYSLGSLGFMLVACSSVYGVWQNSKSTLRAELDGLLHPATAALPVSSPAAKPSSAAVPPAGSNGSLPAEHRVFRPAAPQNKPAVQDGTLAVVRADPAMAEDQELAEFRVELSASERTWISIVQDGKQTFDGVLDSQQTKILQGHDTASIHTGNAGTISYVFNGRPIGPLGPRGEGRTVVFTKSNYEVLDASAHIALAQYPAIVE